jgi:ferritin-like metal-binding protein YciE
MAELTVLDEKLAEVLGLAQAAQAATKKVTMLARKEKDAQLVKALEQMGREAAQMEKRARKVADGREGIKTAVDKKARETKSEVTDFMKTYLEGAEALDGLEFLSMAEAGEMAHVEILGTLAEKAGDAKVRKLVEAATPVQRKHVERVREQSLRLAKEEDPSEPA